MTDTYTSKAEKYAPTARDAEMAQELPHQTFAVVQPLQSIAWSLISIAKSLESINNKMPVEP